CRPGDHRPGRGLLGNRLGVGIVAIDGEVELLQELDSVEVLVAAEFVRNPFAGFSSVVEIQHGRDCIYPQSVDVILLEPEQGTAAEKIPDLGAPVVEYGAIPLRVET